MLALRIAVVLCAFAVHSACVDPDRVLRLLRPLARHSALTATLITRLVPLAAADHARLREAQALRGPAAAPVGRAALDPAAGRPARSIAPSTSPRRSSCAATRAGLPRRAGARRSSRHGWRFAAAGVAIAALGIGARLAGVGELRGLSDGRHRRRPGDPRARRGAAAARRRALPAARPAHRGVGARAPMAEPRRWSRMGAFSYGYPDARRARASRARSRARRGRVRVLAGRSGSASRRCCAPAAGWCRTTTAARWRGRSRSAASTSASTARPSSAAWSGSSARTPRRRSSRRRCAASSSCRSSCAASRRRRGRGRSRR